MTSYVMVGQVKPGLDSLGQVRPCYFRLGSIISG